MQVNDGFEILDEHECAQLLASGAVGRVAVGGPDGTAVLPVTYRVLDGDVMFFTGDGVKLAAAIAGQFVSFEVDEIDVANETGWSVLVSGRLCEISEPEAIARAQAEGVRPWAGRQRTHLVRLHPDLVSGRRLSAMSKATA